MSHGEYYSSVRRILSTIKPETLKKFHRLTTDESRVEFVRSIGGSEGGRGRVELDLSVEPVKLTRHRSSSTKSTSNKDARSSSGRKSSEEAKKYRHRGNELYEKSCLKEALELYTLSILAAPVSEQDDISVADDSKSGEKAKTHSGDPNLVRLQRSESETVPPTCANAEYVLALGNRSACLLQLKKYDECLRDIDLALARGYPTAMRYKLLDRRARALFEMNRFSEAADTLHLLLDGALAESRLDDERRSTLARGAEKKLNFCTSVIISSANQNATPSVAAVSTSSATAAAASTLADCPLELSGSKSKRFPGASDSFDVAYQADRGRYAVAAKDVAVSDVVLIEVPYVSVLSPDQYDKRCYNCFRSNVQVPIGCYGCSTVRYRIKSLI